ncbi:MAG: hypothetical protein DMG58_24195 [Acidobacteria bacterium]|nr:MAG: hypothetical protein DMG58_24195 [Acidobacteriota bacterium]
MRLPVYVIVVVVVSSIASLSCNLVSVSGSSLPAHTITAAQSGNADVTGTDSAALQKAADMLHPGDTLVIGPGTYHMDNSLLIPSGVTVRGAAGKTILLKSRGVESKLAEDGDYGESYLAVAEPEKFRPGMGVEVLDDTLNSGWDVSISKVDAINGKILHLNPMTVRDYDSEQKHGRIRNTFPILCAMNAENVTFEDMIVDGNKAENAYLDGCRGGAIYMYNVRNVTVNRCVARNYNGDGISFQISENVHVMNSESYGQSGYGVHPGTGSANSVVENCRMHHNGDIGLFLCWRVRHGRFSNNVNTIARNGVSGVYFRRETLMNAGHRNIFRKNKVLDNGSAKAGYGFYVQPPTGDIVIEDNQIADTRTTNRTQRYAVYKVKGAGSVRVENNTMEGNIAGTYFEGSAQ